LKSAMHLAADDPMVEPYRYLKVGLMILKSL
jgi:hypothetical protein